MYLFSGFVCMLTVLSLLYPTEVFNIHVLCSMIFNSHACIFSALVGFHPAQTSDSDPELV